MGQKERIFELLEQKKIEQKQFAALIGVTDKTVSAWSTGRSASYTKHTEKIAEVLEVSIDYLITGKKESPTVEDDGLSTEARKLLEEFERLNKAGKMFVLGAVHTARALQDQEEEKEHAGQEKH